MPLNRPSQSELLEALAEYLAAPVSDAGADRFYRRVAFNMVNLIQREQQLGNGFAEQEQQLLHSLLQTALPPTQRPPEQNLDELNAELNQAIANGDLPLTPALSQILLTIAELKLTIDNPRYFIG